MKILGLKAGSVATIDHNTGGGLVWGARVSPEFRSKVREIAAEQNLDPNWYMAVMAFETGRSFSPSIKNPGSTATGLIQFTESTARGLGTTTAQLARMTAVEQLDYVKDYFEEHKNKIKNIGDMYMAAFMPTKGIGRPDSFVLIDKDTSPATYHANSGLDKNKDGKITRGEAVERVLDMYKEGASHIA